MDFKQIQELIKIINKSNIGEICIEEKEFKITIRQKEENITQVVSGSPACSGLWSGPGTGACTRCHIGEVSEKARPVEKPKQKIYSPSRAR